MVFSSNLADVEAKIASKQAFMVMDVPRDKLCGHPVIKKNICGNSDINYKYL